ncbi:MAG TPA: iron-sulfur cluster assembly protein [Terriglobia bacterium]|nr:iron-sulfur cluster assembly protein [Terriglobia bacterium]
MNYTGADPIFLSRDVEVIAVPAGYTVNLPKGTEVSITQALGGSFTLMVPTYGGLFRLPSRDADAIGQTKPAEESGPRAPLSGEELRNEIWQTLKTCYDPEIPVNIVDLGLIYDMQVLPLEEGASRVEVKMTLTAQGCGMGASIAADAQTKLLDLPGVREADVQVVWDPVWTPEKISPEGRTLLGIR